MERGLLSETLHISTHVVKPITRLLQHIFEKRYAHRRFAHTWFAIDLGLMVVALSLIGWVLVRTLFAPPNMENQIRVAATVAPTEVVSGAASTLVFRYENTSNELLKHAQLELAFPAHFSLQEVESEETEIAVQTYELGEIEPGAYGSLKLRGVMFGDVGGDQTFTTTLRFVYGRDNTPVTKIDTHTFQPTRSTLSLTLVLPERVVEGQTVSGEIRYKNTGEIDFPEIAIEPTWPEGFSLVESVPPLVNSRFSLKALAAGEEGCMAFTGQLPAEPSIHFSFAPSFTFGETYYRQDVLEQDVVLLPSQLSVSAELKGGVIVPAANAIILAHLEHVGEGIVQNVQIVARTSHPIFKNSSREVVVGKMAPGDASDVTIELPTYSQLSSSQLSTFQNLTAAIDLYVSYTLPDGIEQDVSLYTESVEGKIASPISLESFARYSSPQGDQIGRGPLPPVVGETTKYWVFLTIDGTTSTLTNVTLETVLGDSVTFTGKQSVSQGDGLQYDEASGTITWSIDALAPTLDPTANAASVAFEVALTPTEAMMDTSPTLIVSPLVTARDSWTGSLLTRRAGTVTTNLPYDSLAAGHSNVTR